ncbi:MAG: class I SAM-dependent methyltransferase [Candidatus Binatia bacterium]
MGDGAISQLWHHVQELVHPARSFPFRGFPVNGRLAERTGAPEAHYAQFAALHERLLATLTPVEPHHVVLEAGCGTGMDAMLLSTRLSPAGRYTGFDISPDTVAWCNAHIAPRLPNFRFRHFDVRNETYNPSGTLAATDVRFPEADAGVDRVIAQSVFTHLLPDVAAHYLREIRRVLRPDGLALVTVFLATAGEIAASSASPVAAFRFPHAHAPGVFVSDARRPSRSVAYEQEVFAQLLSDAGLAARSIVPGYWAVGRAPGDIGQDIVVLARRRSRGDAR